MAALLQGMEPAAGKHAEVEAASDAVEEVQDRINVLLRELAAALTVAAEPLSLSTSAEKIAGDEEAAGKDATKADEGLAVRGLEVEVEALKAAVSKASEEERRAAAVAAERGAGLAKAEGEVTELKAALLQAQNDVARLHTELAALQQAADAAAERKAEVETQEASSKGELAALEAEMAAGKSELARVKEAAAHAATAAAELNAGLTKQVEELTAQVQELSRAGAAAGAVEGEGQEAGEGGDGAVMDTPRLALEKQLQEVPELWTPNPEP